MLLAEISYKLSRYYLNEPQYKEKNLNAPNSDKKNKHLDLPLFDDELFIKDKGKVYDYYICF